MSTISFQHFNPSHPGIIQYIESTIDKMISEHILPSDFELIEICQNICAIGKANDNYIIWDKTGLAYWVCRDNNELVLTWDNDNEEPKFHNNIKVERKPKYDMDQFEQWPIKIVFKKQDEYNRSF